MHFVSTIPVSQLKVGFGCYLCFFRVRLALIPYTLSDMLTQSKIYQSYLSAFLTFVCIRCCPPNGDNEVTLVEILHSFSQIWWRIQRLAHDQHS